MAMKRTTIMADDALLAQLHEIARAENLSLGEVVRQGLEWRVKTRRRVPSFISKPLPADSGKRPYRNEEEEILEYVRATDADR